MTRPRRRNGLFDGLRVELYTQTMLAIRNDDWYFANVHAGGVLNRATNIGVRSGFRLSSNNARLLEVSEPQK